MRPLTLPCPEQALPPWDSFLKQTKEARLCRRAQAVREVVHGHRLHTVSDALHLTYAALRQWGQRCAHQGGLGLVARPRAGRPPKVTCALAHHLARLVDHAPSSTAPAIRRGVVRNSPPCSPARRASNSAVKASATCSKKDGSDRRPTGRLAPDPAELAWAALALAALEYRARRGESLVLYEDETVLWRFALPRAGWWRKGPRARLSTRPLTQRQSKRDESCKRQAWGR
jgi:hypothetical protein